MGGIRKKHTTNLAIPDCPPADPFLTLDVTGVGERGRRTRPELKLGICGEHGADPRSIAFCEEAGWIM